MHPGHHRRDAGRQEGAGRLHRRRARERAILAGSAARSEAARADDRRRELAVADGALGFWKALGEVWPKTREQRCWVHKTANVLNKLPKSQQPKAKRALQEIWMAETKKDAEARAFDAFVETYGVKYEKAVECLTKDRDALLAFYDFPAEHWKHLRTTNPDRKHLRDRAAPHDPIEGMPLEQDRARHGLQARRGRREKLASPRRPQPVAETHPRCKVHRRDRGRQIAKLKPLPPDPSPSPKFGDSSWLVVGTLIRPTYSFRT